MPFKIYLCRVIKNVEFLKGAFTPYDDIVTRYIDEHRDQNDKENLTAITGTFNFKRHSFGRIIQDVWGKAVKLERRRCGKKKMWKEACPWLFKPSTEDGL